MTTAAAHNHHDGAGSGRAPRRTRRLLCAALAIVAASAGLGAVAQSAFGSVGSPHKLTVVLEPAHVRGDIEVVHGSSECMHTAAYTHVVTVASHYPSSPCSSRTALETNRVAQTA